MFKQVALVSLPKQDLLRPPGALPILAAACEEKDIEYEVHDFNLWLYRNVKADGFKWLDANWETIDPWKNRDDERYQFFLTRVRDYVDIMLSHDPDLICVSVFTDVSALCAYELINEINQRPARRNITIAIGGSGIRARHSVFTQGKDFCEHLMSEGMIDHFMYGEGEVNFRNVLEEDYVHGGIDNFDSVQIDDLDQFPFPSYRKINIEDYPYVAHPELIVTGSRGCVRRCTYCDVANYWPRFKYRSGQSIADEIYHYHRELGVSNFEFSDSLINGSLKTFRELNRALIRYKQQDSEFNPRYKGQYICRPIGQIKERDYKEMSEAGCHYIYVGIESFSDSVRYEMRKKFDNVDVDYHLAMCAKYGIENSFLMFVGYPTEQDSDHDMNLEYLRRYQKYAQSGTINLITFGYTAAILKDTPLDHMREQYNIEKEFDDFEYEINWVSADNPKLTIRERIRRWIELVDLADQLGYRQPRIKTLINRYIQILDSIEGRRPFIPISTKQYSQEYLVK